MSQIHYYLHQDDYVFGHVGLFVCMSESTYLHYYFYQSRAKELSIIFLDDLNNHPDLESGLR